MKKEQEELLDCVCLKKTEFSKCFFQICYTYFTILFWIFVYIVRNISHECEKNFSLIVCAIKVAREEHKEYVIKEIQEEAETEQTVGKYN